MGMMILSLIIKTILSFMVIIGKDRSPEIYMAILIPCLILQVIGLILLNQNPTAKTGKIIYAIGIIGFVPIGLIGIFGMKKYIEQNKNISEQE